MVLRHFLPLFVPASEVAALIVTLTLSVPHSPLSDPPWPELSRRGLMIYLDWHSYFFDFSICHNVTCISSLSGVRIILVVEQGRGFETRTELNSTPISLGIKLKTIYNGRLYCKARRKLDRDLSRKTVLKSDGVPCVPLVPYQVWFGPRISLILLVSSRRKGKLISTHLILGLGLVIFLRRLISWLLL